MIFIAGISIALFISALIIVKKDKSKSDFILLIWMILNAAHLSLFHLTSAEAIYDYPHLLGLQFPFPLIHGVLLYYYVSTVTNQLPKKKGIIFLHLLPSILTYIYLIQFFKFSAEEKIEIFRSGGQDYLGFQQVLLFTVFLSGIVYVIWTSYILRKHKKRIRNEFSNIEDINLNWLRLLTYGLGAVWIVVIFTENDGLIHACISIFVIIVGFFGIQQKNIFNTFERKATIDSAIAEEVLKEELPEKELEKAEELMVIKEKYTSSGLSEKKLDEYYAKLNKIITIDKVYTNPDLSLSELASNLDINANYLSQIINKKESKTFYDYINGYRVDEFKRLIAIPKNRQFTLLAVAYDCGFNSKSSFNRYFKKITGLTPSQYVKPLNSEK